MERKRIFYHSVRKPLASAAYLAMAAKYLKKLHEIAKTTGSEEPALNVKMIGYEATMKLGSKKWTSSIQTSSSRAIIDVAKRVLADLRATENAVEKTQELVSDVEMNIQK